jgi:hypothetical protein
LEIAALKSGIQNTFQSTSKVSWLSLGLLYWKLTIEETGIIVLKKLFKLSRFNLSEITSCKVLSFGFIQLLYLKVGGRTHLIVATEGLESIVGSFKGNFRNSFDQHQHKINECHSFVSSVLFGQLYIRAFVAKQIKRSLFEPPDESIFQSVTSLRASFFYEEGLTQDEKKKIEDLITWAKNLDSLIIEFNKQYIPHAKEHAFRLSEEIIGRSLTDQQTEAVVMFEDNNLLVASAGSGKSATLVNKACFAIEKGYVKPEELLVLAFGKKAAEELGDKFKEIARRKPGFIAPKSVGTFHSVGANIIRQCTGNLFLSEAALSTEKFNAEIKKIVSELQSDSEFVWKFAMLCSLFGKQNIFNSRQQDYFQNIFESVKDAWELKGEVKEKGYSLKTLKGENVRSLEELIIANWYLMHNIEYT